MGRREKVVIIVEDEWLIRANAIEILTEDGFETIEASNSDEAMELLHRYDSQIHVLFTDIHMPGTMTGLELAHHARRHWPSISILIVSGRARLSAADLPSQSRFLSKPYENWQVLKHVRELAAAE